ncbi:hypothetical protein Y032_0565g7 [Ancylostoma ceylanicum]|nr:hypothetical protein Y032_0565g7 [Ancylostoma ceylanicum]
MFLRLMPSTNLPDQLKKKEFDIRKQSEELRPGLLSAEQLRSPAHLWIFSSLLNSEHSALPSAENPIHTSSLLFSLPFSAAISGPAVLLPFENTVVSPVS